MRILVLDERDPRHPRSGGAEIHVEAIFGRLARRGHRVSWLCSSFAGGARRETYGALEIERLGSLAVYYPRVVLEVARRTRRGEVDVVVECLNKVPYYTRVYARGPVLAVCHHLFGEVAFEQVPWPIAACVWLSERPLPLAYREVPIVAISESSRDDLIARGLPRERIRVSHCGVARPARPPDLEAARPPRIVYLGRLEPYKRVDVVLECAARLAPRFPELEVVIVGQGSARGSLEERARALGIEGRTHFTGFVADAERDAWLAGARVCVFPSPKEGWGLVVIEANALGTPVVATDAPGLRDSVRHEETGFLVPEGATDGFVERLEKLLADPGLARRMGARALEWSRRFDWDRAADDMEGALHDVVEGRW